MTQQELDHLATEAILYDWACGNTTTAHAKRACRHLGFDIDFRQAEIGNEMEALHIASGQVTMLEI